MRGLSIPRSRTVRWTTPLVTVATAVILRVALRWVLHEDAPFLLFFFAAVMTSAAVGGLGPGLLATALAAAASNYFLTPPIYEFAILDRTQFVGLILFLFEGAFISVLGGGLRQAVRRLEAAEARGEILERRVLQASDRERARVGRDLHDGLGQQLLGVTLLARAAEAQLATGNVAVAAEDLRKIGQVMTDALQWTRDLARQLIAPTLANDGLLSTLQDLAANAERLFGIRCIATAEPRLPAPPPEAGEHLYRIAQEAISNAVKHGRATRVSIHLGAVTNGSSDDPLIGQVLTIRDDGLGLHAIRATGSNGHAGTGLHVMRRRAELIGGRLEVTTASNGNGTPPADGGGTIVRCTFASASALMQESAR